MQGTTMDLNILYRSLLHNEQINEDELLKEIRTAFKLGYDVVAVNTIIGPEQLEGKRSKIPEPLQITLGKGDLPEVNLSGRTYKVLSRLTAVVADNNHCAKLMKSPAVNNYDIIAVNPQNLKVFQHICSSLEVDLIAFDLTTKPAFNWRSNNFAQAAGRGICFEVQYAPCLRSQNDRRSTIANANQLSDLLRGKNIIVTSGAKKMMELRGPFDVSYLGLGIFGLKDDQAKATIRANCKRVILHSEIRRKTGKGIVSIQDIEKVAENEKWLKDACSFVVSVAHESRASTSDSKESDKNEDSDSDALEQPPPAKRSK